MTGTLWSPGGVPVASNWPGWCIWHVGSDNGLLMYNPWLNQLTMREKANVGNLFIAHSPAIILQWKVLFHERVTPLHPLNICVWTYHDKDFSDLWRLFAQCETRPRGCVWLDWVGYKGRHCRFAVSVWSPATLPKSKSQRVEQQCFPPADLYCMYGIIIGAL